MQNYASFAQCTAQALDYTCEAFAAGLSAQQKSQLLQAYTCLPAFADVVPALTRLQAAGFRLFAFSNGGADAVTGLLDSAGLTRYFDGVVSVEEMQTFKPAPAVYSYFLRQAGATGDSTWLVSSNPFDVIGAVSAGLRAAWVRRSNATVFDPWGIDPTLIVTSLAELQDGIATR
jgi:2-haloacid dehalogenase